MKTPYEWKSSLAVIMQDYIVLKRQTGLKFEIQERYLRHFDAFYYYSGFDGITFTKVRVNDFIYNKNERPVSHHNKEIVMKDLACYLNDRGYPAYIPEIKTVLSRCKFVPHIYTKEELQRFFNAVDSYPQTSASFRNSVDPVLFRFLYGTGARISEALNLTIGNTNLETGVVTICGAKNNKDRLLPMANGLTERIKGYVDEFHRYSSEDTWLFPGCVSGKRGHMDKSTAYNHFRDYLLMADISHTSTGPRIHDFRHGLAVLCLKKWVLEGNDLTNMLPYLSAYMGHTDFRATQYYLRLTADLYPDMVNRVEKEFGYVIPEGDLVYE